MGFKQLGEEIEPSKPLFEYARVLTAALTLVAFAAIGGKAVVLSPNRGLLEIINISAVFMLIGLIVALLAKLLHLTRALLRDLWHLPSRPGPIAQFATWFVAMYSLAGLSGLVIYAAIAAVS